MAFSRKSAGHRLNPPKVITFSLSLLLVLAAVASLYTRLPLLQEAVAPHRFGIVLAAYVLLAAGCILRGL